MNKGIVLVFALYLIQGISGHGMMLAPPGRSSMWRFQHPVPPNYQDNENFCGGAYVQNELNGGKCGVCGDSYTDPHPQANENTGIYGTGIIAHTYTPGAIADVGIVLTANHLGSFSYSLCVLPDPNSPEEETCFHNLLLEDGSSVYNVSAEDIIIQNKVRLPEITCERCVLRWTYRCGNNWGMCDDEIWRPGCGPQEHFRSCADIAILPSDPIPEPQPQPQPDHQPEPQPEHQPEPQPEHQPEPQPEHEPKPQPEHEPKPQPEHEPEPQPEIQPIPDPEPVPIRDQDFD